MTLDVWEGNPQDDDHSRQLVFEVDSLRKLPPIHKKEERSFELQIALKLAKLLRGIFLLLFEQVFLEGGDEVGLVLVIEVAVLVQHLVRGEEHQYSSLLRELQVMEELKQLHHGGPLLSLLEIEGGQLAAESQGGNLEAFEGVAEELLADLRGNFAFEFHPEVQLDVLVWLQSSRGEQNRLRVAAEEVLVPEFRRHAQNPHFQGLIFEQHEMPLAFFGKLVQIHVEVVVVQEGLQIVTPEIVFFFEHFLNPFLFDRGKAEKLSDLVEGEELASLQLLQLGELLDDVVYYLLKNKQQIFDLLLLLCTLSLVTSYVLHRSVYDFLQFEEVGDVYVERRSLLDRSIDIVRLVEHYKTLLHQLLNRLTENRVDQVLVAHHQNIPISRLSGKIVRTTLSLLSQRNQVLYVQLVVLGLDFVGDLQDVHVVLTLRGLRLDLFIAVPLELFLGQIPHLFVHTEHFFGSVNQGLVLIATLLRLFDNLIHLGMGPSEVENGVFEIVVFPVGQERREEHLSLTSSSGRLEGDLLLIIGNRRVNLLDKLDLEGVGIVRELSGAFILVHNSRPGLTLCFLGEVGKRETLVGK